MATNGKVAPTPAVANEVAIIAIDRIQTETITVPILGITPLIVHRFSEKAKRAMLDAQLGTKVPKEPRDPEAEYQAAFYRLPDGQPGFPIVAFKEATIGAARFYGKQVTMTALAQSMFFIGETGTDGFALARLDGDCPMREDIVRVGRGTSDLRYRPEFPRWATTIKVIFVPSMLTRNSVLSLIDAGGLGVGVGEWRPERHGTNGTYQIDPNRQVEVLS